MGQADEARVMQESKSFSDSTTQRRHRVVCGLGQARNDPLTGNHLDSASAVRNSRIILISSPSVEVRIETVGRRGRFRVNQLMSSRFPLEKHRMLCVLVEWLARRTTVCKISFSDWMCSWCDRFSGCWAWGYSPRAPALPEHRLLQALRAAIRPSRPPRSQ